MARIAVHLARILMVGLVAAVPVSGLAGSPGSAPTPASPTSELGSWSLPSDAERAVVVAALVHMELGGFGLANAPVVSFHEDVSACAGNLAFWRVEAEVDRVWVCWTHENVGVRGVLQTQALVHELAHVWVHHNTSEAQREAFVAASDSASWNRAAHAWSERGTERAAEIITWAVLDPDVLFVPFEDNACAHWAGAFEALTSRSAPDTIAKSCA